MTTWRALLTPEYMLTFVEAFLLGALPVLGFSDAITNGGTVTVARWPSGPGLLAAFLVGGLNGLRAVKTLLTPPPTPRP